LLDAVQHWGFMSMLGCKRHWGLEVMGLLVCLCFLWNGIGVLLDMPIPHSTSFSIPHALIAEFHSSSSGRDIFGLLWASCVQ